MRNIKWYEGYIADQTSLFNRHGYMYKKNDPSRKRQHRCDDGLDNMIKEYAKRSPIVRSWTNRSEFEQKLKEAKRR